MYAVAHLPNFALQAALRHEPVLWSQMVALVDATQGTPRVCAMTDAAAAAGVTAGLTSPQAMARSRTLIIRHRVPAQEAAAREAVLQCAYGFSPYIENTAPGVCTLDLRGLSELKNATPETLAAWAGRFRQVLAALELRPGIGVGPTPGVAQHAARWTNSVDIVGDPKPFIATLPVAALNPSSDVALLFHKWGVRTVGEMLALGQADLADRIGLEALGLFAAASTHAARPLNLVQPSDRYDEGHEFEEGVETIEPLLFLLRRFVDQIAARLVLGGKVAGLLTLKLSLETGEALERRLRLPQPTADPAILFRMLHTHLETLRTEAPVVSVTLAAEPCLPEQKQFGLFEAALRDPHQFQETLARLSALLGDGRVGTPVRENSHRPEAFKLVPPDFENAPVAMMTRRAAPMRPVPLRRLRPPMKADVETDGAGGKEPEPVAVHCAVANGRLKLSIGPWRASGNWWEPGAWRREEWEACTRDGQTLRLVKQAGGWTVEGVLD